MSENALGVVSLLRPARGEFPALCPDSEPVLTIDAEARASGA